MPPIPGNPNAFPSYPPPQAGDFPGGNWLLKMWGDAMLRSPWAVQPGMQSVPHQYPQMPGAAQGGGLLQQVGDVIPFGKKGLLSSPATEGASAYPGGRGGLLGSQWRDPRFIEQEAARRGIEPGRLQGPSASVKQFATTKAPETGGRQKWSYEDGAGVKREGYFDQSLDGGRTYAFKRPDGRLDMVSGERLKRAQNITTMSPEGPVQKQFREQQAPTTAQMARPVQQTPEISAKLAQARAERAAATDRFVGTTSPKARATQAEMDALMVKAAAQNAKTPMKPLDKQTLERMKGRAREEHGYATAVDLEKIGKSMGVSQKNMMHAMNGAAAAGYKTTPENIRYFIAQMRAQGMFKPESYP